LQGQRALFPERRARIATVLSGAQERGDVSGSETACAKKDTYTGIARVSLQHMVSWQRDEGQGTKETTDVFALHAEIVYWPRLRQQGCFHRFPQPRLALPHFVIVTEVHRHRLNRYSAFKLVPLSS